MEQTAISFPANFTHGVAGVAQIWLRLLALAPGGRAIPPTTKVSNDPRVTLTALSTPAAGQSSRFRVRRTTT